MPARSHDRPLSATRSYIWPSGGRHLWPSGGASHTESHELGHLVYAAGGVLAVHTEAGTSIVPANRIGWTPAGVAHRHRAHGETDMRIVFLSAASARLLPDRAVVFAATDLARELVVALTGPDSYGDVQPVRTPAARKRLTRVLVDELGESHEQSLQLPEPHDDRLQAIARMLREEPGRHESLAELGREVGASTRTLSRLFHDELGMTFYEWRTQLRIYHALVLLADERRPVSQVAHASGWSNTSGFIAAFTDILGTTPGRYRTGVRSRRDV